jgi:hypothetical protein
MLPKTEFDYLIDRIEALDKTARAYMDTISEFHHAMKDAGWHPGRTDDRLTDIIKAKGAEMARLERENEANERNLCQLTDDLAASRRENAELRKDAGRYRWARNALADKEKGVSHWFFCIGNSEELDAAIDEAMKS